MAKQLEAKIQSVENVSGGSIHHTWRQDMQVVTLEGGQKFLSNPRQEGDMSKLVGYTLKINTFPGNHDSDIEWMKVL